MQERRYDVVSLGEALVDFLPAGRGPLAEIASFERHPGGAPANVAIGVARLGGACLFVGAVGEDPFGTYVAQALADEGVDTSLVVRAKGAKTGLAFVSLDESGQPRFYSPGSSVAELLLGPEQVERIPFENVRIVHFSTALLRGEAAREATFRYVARAKEAGCLVAFDPNLRLHHWADPAPLAKDVAALVAHSDVVKLSDAETAFCTGIGDPETAARRLVEAGPRLAVVTCGGAGCVYARRSGIEIEQGRLPARTALVLDTTGAGDAFQATLLTGLSLLAREGLDPLSLPREKLERVLAFAGEAGSRVCEKVGAVAGLPTASELGLTATPGRLRSAR